MRLAGVNLRTNALNKPFKNLNILTNLLSFVSGLGIFAAKNSYTSADSFLISFSTSE
jgi:hypothetical protein